MALAGVGQHFSRNFDQYTIMCVFGSVVGCVVLPLMAQSLESLIITAILFGVTVKTLKKKPASAGPNGGVARDAQEDRKKERKGKKVPCKRQGQAQPQTSGEMIRAQRELDLRRQEVLKLQEKELRLEEKRKKKAKKREERLLKREEERVEKEKLEAARLEQKKEREVNKKRSKQPLLPSVESMHLISDSKSFHRERKSSTSSSVSSISSCSIPVRPKRRPPPKTPKRASSAPLIDVTTPPMDNRPQNSIPQVHQHSSPLPAQCHAPLQMYSMLPVLPFVAPPTPHPHYMYGPVPRLPSTLQPGQECLNPQAAAQNHQASGSVKPHPLSNQSHPFVLWNDVSSGVWPHPPWTGTAQALQMATGHATTADVHVSATRGHVMAAGDKLATSTLSVGNSPLKKEDCVRICAGHPASTGSQVITTAKQVTMATGQVTTGQSSGINLAPLEKDNCVVTEECDTPKTTPSGIDGCGPAQGFYSLFNNKEFASDLSPSSTIWTPASPQTWGEPGEWPEWSDTSETVQKLASTDRC